MKTVLLSALFFFCVPFSFCGEDEGLRASDFSFSGVSGLETAVPEPVRPVIKNWTVLIYVSARNNLALEALRDVNEMEAYGSTDGMNVVVELGRIKGEPIFNPFASVQETVPPQNDWTGSRRFLIKKDQDTETVTSAVLQHAPDSDMGDWKHLTEFITWGKTNFPAKRYLLIVGGHGSGWRGVKEPANKGISYDEISKRHISPAELAGALKSAGGVDVYASDACLMQTFEVLYELRGAADYVVGSQETTPGGGYNYTLMLEKLSSAGEAASGAQAVLEAFSEFYGADKKSVTISIASPAAADKVAAELDNFAGLVLNSPAEMKLYHDKKFSLRNFEDESMRDLYQLMTLYYENSAAPEVKRSAERIIRLIAGELVTRNAAVGYKSKDANGVSIYFPMWYMDYSPRYDRLGFSSATRWNEMVKAVLDSKK
ncbi:MAG: hypothetical protein COT17_06470 [Elusimicrobia bacterium CG08_land_8_20_14_0_20_51_18]|nr:MAG: hypothetical protein COT17_06470 [Elusimicrobia bacterium CG08_land_8_20_14_0_20_51_18]